MTTGPLTLDPYIAQYLKERRNRAELNRSSATDVRSRLTSLAKSFGRRPVSQLGERAIERWLETIGGMRKSSRRAYLSAVKTWCRWMVRRGHIKRDPTEELAKIREPRTAVRALSADKVATLLGSRPDPRSQAILWLMVGVGLRCCEVAALRIEDYDVHERRLFVIGKGSHERLLPVPSALARALDAYIFVIGETAGPMIRSEQDPAAGMSRRTVSKMVVDWMWACGIKRRARDGVSAHALRHTCLSDVADKAKDMRTVQAIGGHKNLATVSIYQRPAEMSKMLEALEGRTYSSEAA